MDEVEFHCEPPTNVPTMVVAFGGWVDRGERRGRELADQGAHSAGGGLAGIDPAAKRHTQKIEGKHLTLRTRIKRLVRKTICFSKTTQMHDIVIGLFVNRYAFGRAV